MTNQPNIGKVILAGAGPGDPGLITVKAARYLRQADVVLTDRLVSEEILNEYVPASAEIIYVGKQYNQEASFQQETINELLVEHALQGKFVVRLKGGDVAILSNILDEIQTLSENNIPYEIIPGVTAASGASAYAAIPLTARGHATSVRFLTYYKTDVVTDQYWKELAGTNDTLVLYMSSGTLGAVVQHLTENKIDADKLLAVIEQATTPLQKVNVINIYDYATLWKDKKFLSPSLVIIGKVVALHEQYAWMNNSSIQDYYFKPVDEQAALKNKPVEPLINEK